MESEGHGDTEFVLAKQNRADAETMRHPFSGEIAKTMKCSKNLKTKTNKEQ
jgi:hypothetical protein